jgi:hypothetical protein
MRARFEFNRGARDNRDQQGIPTAWVARMRESMAGKAWPG